MTTDFGIGKNVKTQFKAVVKAVEKMEKNGFVASNAVFSIGENMKT